MMDGAEAIVREREVDEGREKEKERRVEDGRKEVEGRGRTEGRRGKKVEEMRR